MSNSNVQAPRERHINLLVFDGSGTEPVHAEELGESRFRILYSPGFVEGVAAGDEIELMGSDGRFRIVRRGGNLAIHLFAKSPVASLRNQLEREVETSLSGRVDGGIERALVFTVPLPPVFQQSIGSLMSWFSLIRAWSGHTTTSTTRCRANR